MADDQHSFTRELVSAKYCTETPVSVEPEAGPVRRAQPQRLGAEQAFSWLNKFVLSVLLVAVGTWFCFNRANLTTARLRQRTSSPIDIVLWLCGSKHTFKESIIEATSKPIPELENMKPAYTNPNFDHVDLGSLYYKSPGFQQGANSSGWPGSSDSNHAQH
jgi:hypothetical protein